MASNTIGSVPVITFITWKNALSGQKKLNMFGVCACKNKWIIHRPVNFMQDGKIRGLTISCSFFHPNSNIFCSRFKPYITCACIPADELLHCIFGIICTTVYTVFSRISPLGAYFFNFLFKRGTIGRGLIGRRVYWKGAYWRKYGI